MPIRLPGGEEKIIRIHEMHMEEDAGKLVHDPWIDQTRADYNRCGVPLIEIVTEPDFRTAEEVIAYLEKLQIHRWSIWACPTVRCRRAPCAAT